jgi:hypothetical protein
VKARTAQANHIRGLLSEYGIVLAQEINYITRGIPAILEDSENALPVTPHSNDYPPRPRFVQRFRQIETKFRTLVSNAG